MTLASGQATAARTRRRGIACLIGGLVAVTLNDSIVKWLSGAYPLHEIILIRALVALAVTVLIARLEGGLDLLKTRRPLAHLARGLLVLIANMAYFLALAAMPMADAAAIFFVAPLFITALSVPFLGERVGARRWLAVGVGMGGETPLGDILSGIPLSGRISCSSGTRGCAHCGI